MLNHKASKTTANHSTVYTKWTPRNSPQHTHTSPETSDTYKTAQVHVLGAQAAYQFKGPRWLHSFNQAMEQIEECPTELQDVLKKRLCSAPSHWKKRPQRRR